MKVNRSVKIGIALCVLLAAVCVIIAQAVTTQPETITKIYYVNSSSTWCAAYTSKREGGAAQAFIDPVTNTAICWRESETFIVQTNDSAAVTNTCEWSDYMTSYGMSIDFRGRYVDGLLLKASTGESNEVRITWFGY